MSEFQIGEFLLELAILFGTTYLLGSLLLRLRFPVILGALLVAMAAQYTPIAKRLLTTPINEPFSFLAELGVLFLLFYIGLQINLKEFRTATGDIIWLTALNTTFPFLLGMGVMLTLGYGWLLAFVIGLTRMPTAEAVIVPILDEFRLLKTRVGMFIVGAGVLDDIIEVFLIAFVSIWIGWKPAALVEGTEEKILVLTVSTLAFMILAIISYRWLRRLASLMPGNPRNLTLLTILVLFTFGGITEYSGLGIVVGAIVAGVVLRPLFTEMGQIGEQVTQTIRLISYSFLGLVFFFWVGLSVDLGGIIHSPLLAILLYLAGTIGKMSGVMVMVPMGRLTLREAWVVGVGLNARLTTEIIVAKLLFEYNIIDLNLFTALVTASALSTITVPLVFALLTRRWGRHFRDTMEVTVNNH